MCMEQLRTLHAQAKAKADSWEALAIAAQGTKGEQSCRDEVATFREIENMYAEQMLKEQARLDQK